MKYLLDTDHISFLQLGSGAEYALLSTRMAQIPLSEFAFFIISFHEQVLGAHTFLGRARTPQEVVRGYNLLLEILGSFLPVPVLSYDDPAAAIFDGLRKQRIRIATLDLRIAAIALSRGLILLTRNMGDFSQVPGLLTENWTV